VKNKKRISKVLRFIEYTGWSVVSQQRIFSKSLEAMSGDGQKTVACPQNSSSTIVILLSMYTIFTELRILTETLNIFPISSV
jgi:hypothetical protein